MNKEILSVTAIPLLTGLWLVIVHCFFGQIILRRGIVFLDLCMAQFASLGYIIANYLTDIKHVKFIENIPKQFISIVSVLVPTFLLIILTDKNTRRLLEGIIAMLYAFSFSVSVLIVEKLPGGFEEIKEQFLGSLVTINSKDLMHLLILYIPVILVNIFLFKKYISEHTGRILDAIFYFSLGLVVTSSVKLIGVFTIFTLLVIPPLTSLLLFSNFLYSLIFSYILGFIAVIISVFSIDTPTTPLLTFLSGSMFFIIFIIKKLLSLLSFRTW